MDVMEFKDSQKGFCPEIVEAYERLAYEIVLTACRDYVRAVRRACRNGMDVDALIEVDSIERFFRSGWFRVLCRLDPEVLICRLQEEVVGR